MRKDRPYRRSRRALRPVTPSVRQRTLYRVCGLQLGSTVPFPELRAEPNSLRKYATDIEFKMGRDVSCCGSGEVVMTWEEPGGDPWLTCTKTDGGYRFHFPALADFLVDRLGRQVTCFTAPGTAPETIRHLFLDQVIPPLLNLRGREALHASAIRTDLGACAFIGRSGQGKSTLAAAFHAIGHPVLCDDCLLLRTGPGPVSVESAYPGLRLWDDSRGALFGDARPTLPVSHYTSKRRVSTLASDAEQLGPTPLRGIYSLQRCGRGASTEPAIESLSVRDAFMELVEFAFRLDLSDRTMMLRQMDVLERVALEVPVRRLHLPDDLGALAQARRMILQDLQREQVQACA